MENRLTDNEIIKALECCVECDTYLDECVDGCPLREVNDCTSVLRRITLDILNRQKAEIERLKKDKYIIKDGVLELVPRTDIEEIKSEAIKEFAERFDSMLADFDDYDTLHIYEIKDRIDLVKEME